MPFRLLTRCYDHLCDPVAMLHSEWLRPEIDQQYLDLSAIIGINSTRRVKHRNPMLVSQAAPGPDLRLIICRKFNIQAGRNQDPLQGVDYHWLIDNSAQVSTCRHFSLVCRQGEIACVLDLYGDFQSRLQI